MSGPVPTPTRPDARLALLTATELRKAAAPDAGRWLLVSAAAVGLLVAVIIAVTVPAAERDVILVSYAVQSAISLPLPFVSVVLMPRDLGRRVAPPAGSGRLVAAKLLASGVI